MGQVDTTKYTYIYEEDKSPTCVNTEETGLYMLYMFICVTEPNTENIWKPAAALPDNLDKHRDSLKSGRKKKKKKMLGKKYFMWKENVEKICVQNPLGRKVKQNPWPKTPETRLSP